MRHIKIAWVPLVLCVGLLVWIALVPGHAAQTYEGTYSVPKCASGDMATYSVNGRPTVCSPSLPSATFTTSTAPAPCGANLICHFVLPAGSVSETVDDTSIQPESDLQLHQDTSLGTLLGVTCNTTAEAPLVTARTTGTSLTFSVPAAPATNPECLTLNIINPPANFAPPVTNGLIAEWYANTYADVSPNTVQNDISGNGYTANAAGTGATYVANCINSQACIEYGGTTATADYAFPATAPLGNSTLFIIAQNSNTATNAAIMSGASGSITWFMNNNGGTATPGYITFYDTGDSHITASSSTCAATSGDWFDAAIAVDTSSGAYTIDCDGSSIGSGTAAAWSPSAGESVFACNFAGGSCSTNQSTLYQALVLLYNRVLSPAEISAVRTWELTLFPSVP